MGNIGNIKDQLLKQNRNEQQTNTTDNCIPKPTKERR